MTSDAPRRRGRPVVAEEDRKTANLTFRTRGGLRAQLEEAAQESGRSVSEEIEYRLQTSFDRQSVAKQIYGQKHDGLIRALSSILGSAGDAGGCPDSVANLVAITTIFAYSGENYRSLVKKNVDPSVWFYLSQHAISHSRGLGMEDAGYAAERAVPEMAVEMAEYRAGVEMARRLKKAKSE